MESSVSLRATTAAAPAAVTNGADIQTTETQCQPSVTSTRVVVRVLAWVICVGLAGAISAGYSTKSTQVSVSLTRFMGLAFGPNGLVDAELMPSPDDQQTTSAETARHSPGKTADAAL
jgi:hypothetical protein